MLQCAMQRGKLGRSSTRGEKAERRQSGRFEFLIYDVRSDVKVWRDVEHTGNNTELESSRKRVLQWR
jgi:hypothetical protein